MKAIINTRYGAAKVLELVDFVNPVPQNNEVLIKIYSTSVTAAHCAMREGKPLFGRLFMGLTKPKILIPGTDLAGEVINIGDDVKNFNVGDKVFAATDINGGAYAEYISISENDVIAHMPNNMNYNEASAIIEGGTTALSFLRDSGKIKPGKKILINGASGSIGTAAVQLAKYFGADVTGVCSTANVDMVKDLGADNVIDYKKENFTKRNEQYDIIFDTVGKSSFNDCKEMLYMNGIFLSPVLSLSLLTQMLFTSIFGKKKAIFTATGLRKPEVKITDLMFLKELIEAGKLKSVIDREFKLEETVEAHKYVEKGHKKGNVVLQMVTN